MFACKKNQNEHFSNSFYRIVKKKRNNKNIQELILRDFLLHSICLKFYHQTVQLQYYIARPKLIYYLKL